MPRVQAQACPQPECQTVKRQLARSCSRVTLLQKERDAAVSECKAAKEKVAKALASNYNMRDTIDALKLELRSKAHREHPAAPGNRIRRRDDRDDGECCICLEPAAAAARTGFGNRACSHTVHVDCGRLLAGDESNQKCPLCRTDFEFLTCDAEQEMKKKKRKKEQ
ncbi:UPF0547 [Diplonema papillatum]|nr:UPF0547 [Diplonema papillatum]